MRLRVLYFASARDAAGRKDESFEMDGSPTVAQLAGVIQTKHPELKAVEKSTRYSVNLEIVENNAALRDGDEVGVLPAVAGG